MESGKGSACGEPEDYVTKFYSPQRHRERRDFKYHLSRRVESFYFSPSQRKIKKVFFAYSASQVPQAGRAVIK